jgi:hypothetical protein
MAAQQLIGSDRLAIVRMARDDRWVRLGLRLTHEFTGGDLVRFAEIATVSLEGADELSATYGRANWVSGVTSGALYAFRTLRIPRQRLFLTELCGCLRASDMDAVANTSAIAIARLADKELPGLPTEGWSIETQIIEQPPLRVPDNGQEAVAANGLDGAAERLGKPVAAPD